MLLCYSVILEYTNVILIDVSLVGYIYIYYLNGAYICVT